MLDLLMDIAVYLVVAAAGVSIILWDRYLNG